MKNLILRTLTGILFVAVLVTCIVYSPLTFAAIFAIITGLTAWEFCHIVNARGDVRINGFICALASAYLFIAVWCNCIIATPILFVPYIAAILYLVISELYRAPFEHTLNTWAFTIMSQLYVAVPFALLNFLEFSDNPGTYVLALFVFLWCSDTGAYCTGSLIGRHKLFPSVSPSKTWEGCIGGAVLALLTSQVICYLSGGVDESLSDAFCDYAFWAGMALITVVFGTWGDLVESLLKRRLAIKDSGHALPGHGGWLDRFDSTLLAVPAVLVYLLCCQ